MIPAEFVLVLDGTLLDDEGIECLVGSRWWLRPEMTEIA
jgi:hypothetical protein